MSEVDPHDEYTVSEYAEVTLPATGNLFECREYEHTFIEISGGEGNRGSGEVHVLIRSNDGEFAQGWFDGADLLNAVADAWMLTRRGV